MEKQAQDLDQHFTKQDIQISDKDMKSDQHHLLSLKRKAH